MDLANAPTASWEPEAPHHRLAALAGRWSGRGKLWLDPSAPAEEADITAAAALVLGGRLLRLAYVSTATGKPHAGEFTLGWDTNERRWVAAWIDSFHMGTGVMQGRGAVGEPGPIVLEADYRAGDERWGWRIAFRPEGADRLVIEMTNLVPGHGEFPAVEWAFERRR